MSFWKKDAKPIVGEKGVKYGLQTVSKPKEAAPSRPKLAAFGDDTEPDVGDINAARRAQAGTRRSDAKYEKLHAAALSEDPSVYDYDSFYDGIQAEREAQKLAAHAKEKAGPQYIHALQAAKEQREREQNIIYERRLERDRKVEDALHGDKEVFVSNAYKRKLLEDKLWQANQDAKDKRDEKQSARARGNMDGMLNLISSALQEPSSPPPEGPHDSAEAEAGGEASTASDRHGGANVLEADLQKRANVKIQKAVEEMDKYELARYGAEQRLRERTEKGRAAPSADAGEAGSARLERRTSEAEAAAPGEQGSGVPRGGGDKAGACPSQEQADEKAGADGGKGTLKRRAGEAEISAARERYLARKNARREGAQLT